MLIKDSGAHKQRPYNLLEILNLAKKHEKITSNVQTYINKVYTFFIMYITILDS